MTSRFHWVAAIAMTAALSGTTAAQASTAWITQAEPVYPRPGLDLSPPDSSDPFGVWMSARGETVAVLKRPADARLHLRR